MAQIKTNLQYGVTGSLQTGSIAADAITDAKIADDVVGTEHLTAGEVDATAIADNAITLAKMAGGTDGNLITYDASGNPAYVASGTSGHFLKSQGADTVPVFAAAGGGKILQVVQATVASASTHNTVSTFTASNVLGAITPTAASSKIFVSVFWLGTVSNESAQLASGAAKIYRDIDSAGYAALFPSSIGGGQFRITREVGSGGLSLRCYQNITYLDSPSYSLTDVITYKLYAAAGPSGWGTYFVCPDGDSASVIMMEVAA